LKTEYDKKGSRQKCLPAAFFIRYHLQGNAPLARPFFNPAYGFQQPRRRAETETENAPVDEFHDQAV
jgi:hypothetical protein